MASACGYDNPSTHMMAIMQQWRCDVASIEYKSHLNIQCEGAAGSDSSAGMMALHSAYLPGDGFI